METRVIKYNLNRFIYLYDIYKSCNALKNKNIVLKGFKRYYISCTPKLKSEIQNYLNKNKVALQHKELFNIESLF